MGTGGMRCGAGRPGWRIKAGHCLRLDVRDLARLGVLRREGHHGWRWTNSHTGEETGSIGINVYDGALRLSYSSNGTPRHQNVEIERTPCYFGGTRPWLLCPRCGARVGVLFMRLGSFQCRRCGGVAYGSQSEDACGRSWRIEQKLAKRLGDNWTRPRGMHRTTYSKIVSGIVKAQQMREEALAGYLSRLSARLQKLGDGMGLDL